MGPTLPYYYSQPAILSIPGPRHMGMAFMVWALPYYYIYPGIIIDSPYHTYLLL